MMLAMDMQQQQMLDNWFYKALEPYQQMIEQLKNKQREKEAEILVLKYALVEMDRKYQELDKKTATTASKTGAAAYGRSAVGTRPVQRATLASRQGSRVTTPREQSKPAPNVGRQSMTGTGARERSKTPSSQSTVGNSRGGLQNKLNQSMHSRQGGTRDSGLNQTHISTGGRTSIGGTRANSNTRNNDQSQNRRLGSAVKQSSSRLVQPSSTKNQLNSSMNFDQQKSRNGSKTGIRGDSRAGSQRRGTHDVKSSSGNLKGNGREETKTTATTRKQSGAFATNQSADKNLNLNAPINQFFESAIQASFGRISTYVYAPDAKPQRNDPSIKPQVNMKLTYVPSYNGKTSRNNLIFIDSEHILFYSSTVIVVMNIFSYQQQILQGHTEEIQHIGFNKPIFMMCSAQKPDKKDRNNPQPYFSIWDLKNCSRLASVSYHQDNIGQVGFCENGEYLVTVGGSYHDKVTVAVWKVKDLLNAGKNNKNVIKNMQPIAEAIVGKQCMVNALYFDHGHSDSHNLNIVLAMDKGVKFFTIKLQEKQIEERKAQFDGSNENIGNIYGVAFQGDEIYAGGENGYVYIYKQDYTIDQKFKAEQTGIHCLGFINRNDISYLMTLSDSGRVQLWNEQNQPASNHELYDEEINCKLGSESLKLTPRSFGFKNDILVIGFHENIIMKYDMHRNHREVLIAGPAQQPQYITMHPTRKIYAVVGLDKHLRLYSYEAHMLKKKNSLINCIELQYQAKSCDFSPDGKYFAMGYENGVFEVFQVYDNDGEYFQIDCLKLFDLNRRYPVQCVKFSPNGKYLVITCNKDIVVFNATTEDFDQEGLLKGNIQQVTFIQFDKTSQYAMTNSIDGQVLSWDLQPGAFTRIDPAKIKEVDWDRKCCVYAWDTIGCWQNDMIETDINSITVSTDNRLVAIGDALGPPKVFQYPAHLPNQACVTLDNGHINQVICVKFTPDDMFLMTLGEGDNTILIWTYKAFGMNKEQVAQASSQNVASSAQGLQIYNQTSSSGSQAKMTGLLSQLNSSVEYSQQQYFTNDNYQNRTPNNRQGGGNSGGVVGYQNQFNSDIAVNQRLEMLGQSQSKKVAQNDESLLD